MTARRRSALRWLAACAALLAIAGGAYLLTRGEEEDSPSSSDRATVGLDGGAVRVPVGAPRGEVAESPLGPQPSAGMTLKVPAIGVSAQIVELGLKPNGELEVPEDYDEVGLWIGGPKPGDDGPALLAGHVDSAATGPAVFYRLGDLRPGDEIQVTDDAGRRSAFEVDHLEEHPKSDFPTNSVYGRTSGAELRLVTCSGEFDPASRHYRNNLIVFAKKA